MGHVDHGKSTLLDYIRKANTVEGEAGGITQHLSAYEATHTTKENGVKKITFLDTPGHAAFSQMRSRGARVADIAILVVSAEDGVQMQTKEALAQIKEAGIPYIIALTKIDKPNANIDRAKNSLLENEIYVEGYGGDIPCVPVSAKSGQGIDELLDMLLLVAEMGELHGDPSKPAEGVVIESHVDPRKGTSATLMIKDGVLKKGDFIVAEDCMAPVRGIENHAGEHISEAGLSTPVGITGFNKVPAVGAPFRAYSSKKEAEKAVMQFGTQAPVQTAHADAPQSPEKVSVPIVIKTDVLGTLEAIEAAVENLSNEFVQPKIIHSGVGDISENDMKVATGAENPIVVGFHTKADKRAVQLGERFGIEVHTFDIIYKLTEWLEEELARRIPKEMKQEVIGRAEVLRVFNAEKRRQVLGGKVLEGVVRNNTRFHLVRRGHPLGDGEIVELQHMKAKVGEVDSGKEFGMMTESKLELVKGDIIECFIQA